MRKYRLFFTNISKEEAWINQITAQDYRLKKIALFWDNIHSKSTSPLPKILLKNFQKQKHFFLKFGLISASFPSRKLLKII